MTIAIGSDHRGFELKRRLSSMMRELGHTITDFGTNSMEGVDYPDFAFAVANAIGKGELERGVLVCGTGIGMCIAANKVPGVRAANCHDQITAEMSRRHNNANIICLSADLISADLIEKMVRVFLDTEFESGRHQRRVEKITEFEKTHLS